LWLPCVGRKMPGFGKQIDEVPLSVISCGEVRKQVGNVRLTPVAATAWAKSIPALGRADDDFAESASLTDAS
jgi:hypothetical protein